MGAVVVTLGDGRRYAVDDDDPGVDFHYGAPALPSTNWSMLVMRVTASADVENFRVSLRLLRSVSSILLMTLTACRQKADVLRSEARADFLRCMHPLRHFVFGCQLRGARGVMLFSPVDASPMLKTDAALTALSAEDAEALCFPWLCAGDRQDLGGLLTLMETLARPLCAMSLNQLHAHLLAASGCLRAPDTPPAVMADFLKEHAALVRSHTVSAAGHGGGKKEEEEKEDEECVLSAALEAMILLFPMRRQAALQTTMRDFSLAMLIAETMHDKHKRLPLHHTSA